MKLHTEKIIEWYDYPVVFIASDESGNQKFICVFYKEEQECSEDQKRKDEANDRHRANVHAQRDERKDEYRAGKAQSDEMQQIDASEKNMILSEIIERAQLTLLHYERRFGQPQKNVQREIQKFEHYEYEHDPTDAEAVASAHSRLFHQESEFG